MPPRATSYSTIDNSWKVFSAPFLGLRGGHPVARMSTPWWIASFKKHFIISSHFFSKPDIFVSSKNVFFSKGRFFLWFLLLWSKTWTLVLFIFFSLALFLYLIPKLRTYFNVCLIDGAARIFPSSYSATGNQTHGSSVAHLSLRDLSKGSFIDWATAAAASAYSSNHIWLK